MSEKGTKICLIGLNVIVLFAGVVLFVCGLLLEYTTVGESVLMTLDSVVTSSQLGAIGVTIVALGAFVMLISFVGCCGAVSESRCMLTLYFGILGLLFLGLVAVFSVSFYFGGQFFYETINENLKRYVEAYDAIAEEVVIVDSVQQFFQCCGYNGTGDFINYNPSNSSMSTSAMPDNVATATLMMTTNMTMTNMTMTNVAVTSIPAPETAQSNTTGTSQTMNSTMSVTTSPTFLSGNWPVSCCKIAGGEYIDTAKCQDNTLSLSVLQTYLNTQGCTSAIEEWVQQNLLIIGGVSVGIAVVMLIAMIAACSLRSDLD